MRLLEDVAFQGIRFPAPLIMLSKVLFTLDGILDDIGGDRASMGMVMARHIAPTPDAPGRLCLATYYGRLGGNSMQRASLQQPVVDQR